MRTDSQAQKLRLVFGQGHSSLNILNIRHVEFSFPSYQIQENPSLSSGNSASVVKGDFNYSHCVIFSEACNK